MEDVQNPLIINDNAEEIPAVAAERSKEVTHAPKDSTEANFSLKDNYTNE